MNQSAIGTRQKFQTLSNEIIRWMRNTDRLTTPIERATILTGLMRKMARSGYPLEMRRQVLQSGSQGYYTMVKNQRTRIRRINRTRDRVMDQERLERKITELTNWFRNPVPPLPQVESNQDSHRNQIQRAGSRTKGRAKQGRTDTGNVGEKNTAESIMFVPATPHSDLM